MSGLSVAAPGSVGELVQGRLDGYDFHVSCPIDLFSRARARVSKGALDIDGLMPKARLAALAALRLSKSGRPKIVLDLKSDLKPGKGMASSTADIAATAAALAMAVGWRPAPDQLAKLALAIEPTDGTLFQGIVAFDHRRGSRLSFLGPAPPLKITYIDTGGSIDTIEFNKKKKRYTASQLRRIELAFELVRAGLKGSDPRLIGRASTLSAQVNQEVLPKPAFDDLLAVSRAIGGYGVVVAHSGTVAGILHDLPAADVCRTMAGIGGAGQPTTVRMINGGWRRCWD